MMKTPDEIKKGLELCIAGVYDCCRCSYHEAGNGDCVTDVKCDALALIQQLQAQNAELLEKVDRFSKVAFEQNMVILGKQDVITKQERVRANLQDEIWQLEQKIPRWISVEERLPEYGKDHYVLCVVAHKNPEYKGRHVDVYEYDARPLWDGYSPHFDISGWANAEDLYVTHWMPLPEPPKEVT